MRKDDIRVIFDERKQVMTISPYTGYGSGVIMDKVDELPTLEEQIALIREAMRDEELAKRMHANPRFNQWLIDHKNQLVAMCAVQQVEDKPGVFWLIDSRSRGQIGSRIVYQFPDTPDGVRAIWKLVVDQECPDEWNDYAGLAEVADEDGPSVIFNDYWACYGWHLALYDDDAELPKDCILRQS